MKTDDTVPPQADRHSLLFLECQASWFPGPGVEACELGAGRRWVAAGRRFYP